MQEKNINDMSIQDIENCLSEPVIALQNLNKKLIKRIQFLKDESNDNNEKMRLRELKDEINAIIDFKRQFDLREIVTESYPIMLPPDLHFPEEIFFTILSDAIFTGYDRIMFRTISKAVKHMVDNLPFNEKYIFHKQLNLAVRTNSYTNDSQQLTPVTLPSILDNIKKLPNDKKEAIIANLADNSEEIGSILKINLADCQSKCELYNILFPGLVGGCLGIIIYFVLAVSSPMPFLLILLPAFTCFGAIVVAFILNIYLHEVNQTKNELIKNNANQFFNLSTEKDAVIDNTISLDSIKIMSSSEEEVYDEDMPLISRP